MTTKPVFPALGAPTSLAWVHGSPRVEELALPKSVESGNLQGHARLLPHSKC
jgi:hypothetical protein